MVRSKIMQATKQKLLTELSSCMSLEAHHDWLWPLDDRRSQLAVSNYTRHVCAAAEFGLDRDIKWTQVTL